MKISWAPNQIPSHLHLPRCNICWREIERNNLIELRWSAKSTITVDEKDSLYTHFTCKFPVCQTDLCSHPQWFYIPIFRNHLHTSCLVSGVCKAQSTRIHLILYFRWWCGWVVVLLHHRVINLNMYVCTFLALRYHGIINRVIESFEAFHHKSFDTLLYCTLAFSIFRHFKGVNNFPHKKLETFERKIIWNKFQR